MRNNVVELLKRVDWGSLGASLIVIHGSVLWNRNPHDVDIVAIPRRDVDPEELGLRLMEVVEKVVGLEADIYVITDPLDTNCFLFLEALRRGVIIYQDDYGCEMLVKIASICYDFMLARKTVGYTETLVKQVMESVA